MMQMQKYIFRKLTFLSGVILLGCFSFSLNHFAIAIQLEADDDLSEDKEPRYKIPTDTQRKKIVAQVNEIFGDQIRKANTAKKQFALANTLLKEAQGTTGDSATRFVLYLESSRQFIKAGSVTHMIGVLDAIVSEYDVQPIEFRAKMILDTAKFVPKSQTLQLTKQLLAVANDASESEKYDTALELISKSKSLLRKAKIRSLNTQLLALTKSIKKKKQDYELVQKAMKILKNNPSDPVSNLRYGKYLCFVKGNWDAGMALIAKSKASDLQKLAALDAKNPTSSDVQLAVADAWYELAKDTKSQDQIHFYTRANHWYQKALPELVNLNKTKAKKRIQEVEEAITKLRIGTKSNKVGKNALEITLSSKVRIRFRLIPAGSVQVAPNKKTLVKIPKTFYLGETEVTQAQWRQVMGSNPSKNKGNLNLPVEMVSKDDCLAFLKRLNASKLGKTYHFRLPKSAEWVHACRAGKKTTYFFGNDQIQLVNYAWYNVNSKSGLPQPVAGKKPNPWGLYDTLGNVWEICEDNVERGGSSKSELKSVQYHITFRIENNLKIDTMGFRILCELK